MIKLKELFIRKINTLKFYWQMKKGYKSMNLLQNENELWNQNKTEDKGN